MIGDFNKLKIVFSIHTSKNSTVIGGIEFHSELGEGMSNLEILQRLQNAMNDLDIPLIFGVGKSKISLSEFQDHIKNNGKFPEFDIQGFSISVGRIPAMRQGFISIEERSVKAENSWDKWVARFSNSPLFVQAWIVNKEYDYWQNASDPLEYSAANKEYVGLSLRSNGLPAPLNRDVIDTSRNPGRWIMRNGYIEAIGSEMWLGENFWKSLGEDRRSLVENSEIIVTEESSNKIIKIIAAENCFNEQSDSATQNALRKLIYGV